MKTSRHGVSHNQTKPNLIPLKPDYLSWSVWNALTHEQQLRYGILPEETPEQRLQRALGGLFSPLQENSQQELSQPETAVSITAYIARLAATVDVRAYLAIKLLDQRPETRGQGRYHREEIYKVFESWGITGKRTQQKIIARGNGRYYDVTPYGYLRVKGLARIQEATGTRILGRDKRRVAIETAVLSDAYETKQECFYLSFTAGKETFIASQERIANEFGVSRQTVANWTYNLAQAGRLQRKRNISNLGRFTEDKQREELYQGNIVYMVTDALGRLGRKGQRNLVQKLPYEYNHESAERLPSNGTAKKLAHENRRERLTYHELYQGKQKRSRLFFSDASKASKAHSRDDSKNAFYPHLTDKLTPSAYSMSRLDIANIYGRF